MQKIPKSYSKKFVYKAGIVHGYIIKKWQKWPDAQLVHKKEYLKTVRTIWNGRRFLRLPLDCLIIRQASISRHRLSFSVVPFVLSLPVGCSFPESEDLPA